MKQIIKKGTTSKLLQIFIQDSSKTDGSGLTGLAHDTASLTCYYLKEGSSSAVEITLVTATVGTYTSGGFKEVDATNIPGVYEIDIPNACLTGAEQVIVMLKGAANMAPVVLEVQLVDNTEKDAVDGIDDIKGTGFVKDTDSLKGKNMNKILWNAK